MLVETLMAVGFGGIVGLALGLTGGGGSLFAVPLLIYGLQLPPTEAVPMSLVAVGLTALVGAMHAIRARLVLWRPTVMFALGGVIGAPLGLLMAHFVPAEWLMTGFAALALSIGVLMWLRVSRRPGEASAVRANPAGGDGGAICVLAPDGQLRFTAPCAVVLSVVGIGTGFLSGLFGVGGGFLIVPALVLVTRMGVHNAVATSLLIISAIGFAGAASAILHGDVNWAILLPFAAGGAVAMLTGRQFARRVAGPTLQRVFSMLIVLVGFAMLAHMVF